MSEGYYYPFISSQPLPYSANIGNAKVLGLARELRLTDNQYNLALSIFFVGYVIYETPSNIILRKTSPRFYIPVMVVCAI